MKDEDPGLLYEKAMNIGWCIVAVLTLVSGCIPAHAETIRDPAQVRAFKTIHPCPATGKATGACPGYVVDHIIPLCAGGRDEPANMQYQDVVAGHQKDRLERWICTFKRSGKGWACPAIKMGKQQ